MLRKGSRHPRCVVPLSAVLYLAFSSMNPLFGQSPPNSPSPQSSESEEIHRLNEKIAAQALKIAAQAEHLAAQQKKINALEFGLAEQKVLLNKILQSGRTVL